MLANVGVLAIVASKLDKAELTAEHTLEELRRIAFFDFGELFDDRGNLKNVKTLPPEVRAVLAASEVVRTNIVAGDHKREWLHKVKVVDDPRTKLFRRQGGLPVEFLNFGLGLGPHPLSEGSPASLVWPALSHLW